MKVAVLGATGMAGHVISLYLEELGYEVFRLSRSGGTEGKAISIDASDCRGLTACLDAIDPDVVVNAVGLLQKESETYPDLAVLLNAYLPHHISTHYRERRARLIHLSTDCVFSGESGGYLEHSVRDGKTMYDRTKALGEVVNDKDLTFRMSIVGPDRRKNGTGLFHWFMQQRGVVRGYTRAVWNGVTTVELARAVHEAIRQNLTGLYHLTPAATITKYELCRLFRDAFDRKDIEIVPYDGFVVDKTLVNTRSDFDFGLPDYPEMINRMALWVREHRELYSYA